MEMKHNRLKTNSNVLFPMLPGIRLKLPNRGNKTFCLQDGCAGTAPPDASWTLPEIEEPAPQSLPALFCAGSDVEVIRREKRAGEEFASLKKTYAGMALALIAGVFLFAK